MTPKTKNEPPPAAGQDAATLDRFGGRPSGASSPSPGAPPPAPQPEMKVTGPMLKKIHVLRDELAIQEDHWPDLLEQEFEGIRSSKDLTVSQGAGLIEKMEGELVRRRREQTAMVLVEHPQATPGLPVPIMDAKAFRVCYEQIVALRNSVLDVDDIVTAKSVDRNGKEVERTYIKKSGHQKLALLFGLMDRVVGKQRIALEGSDHVVWQVEVEVATPGRGRVVSASGSCSTLEPVEKGKGRVSRAEAEHWALAKAETRAFSRAVSKMLGSAAVSAEEIGAADEGE